MLKIRIFGQMRLKYELQNIISGNGSVRNGGNIQAITDYLRGKKEAIPNPEEAEFDKFEETKILIEFISISELWYLEIDESKYIGEGAEQKIYECADSNYVLKLNDSIFYALWEDYLNNLLVHNYFFPRLAYELLGFQMKDDRLFAVVKQPFIIATENTNLDNVREFMISNGFLHKKGNDYFHPELGIILEDLHDENVLSEGGALQFIDTVFFLTDSFYETDAP